MSVPPLNERQLDALREISNVGMGHAATALSQLTGRTIRLNVPQVLLADAATLAGLVGAAKEPAIGIHLHMLGTAQGDILIVFPRGNTATMLDRLLPQKMSSMESLTELECSALNEVGNILASAYLNALGDMLHMTLLPSAPVLSLGTVGAMIDGAFVGSDRITGKTLLIETEVFSPDQGIKSRFFLFPAPSSVSIILATIDSKE